MHSNLANEANVIFITGNTVAVVRLLAITSVQARQAAIDITIVMGARQTVAPGSAAISKCKVGAAGIGETKKTGCVTGRGSRWMACECER
jgi:hypothetical protein